MPDTAAIELIIEPARRDLGGFSVRRALPDKRRRLIGPFIFFDHMGPADFAPGNGVNVRSHPHIGLATVTYLFEGEMLHRDSLGFVQPIRPGAVNWMTAGKGIVHSEKVTDEVLESGQRLHGIQTWVALPAEAEEIEPSFEHYSADAVPDVALPGGHARVIIGSAFGVDSPVATQSDTLYVELKLEAAASVELPPTEELGVYVVAGEVEVAGQAVGAGKLAVIEAGARGAVAALTSSHVMLCGGARLDGERHIWWNFVSSSRERISAAKDAWRDGQFDMVPGEDDFIPLPSV